MKFDKGKIFLDRINAEKNIISINGDDAQLAYLESGPPGGKGGNSSVFRIISDSDILDEKVIKICNYCTSSSTPQHKRLLRFEREIEALKEAKEKGLSEWIVDIIMDGEFQLNSLTFKYYIMPKADMDLTQYLDKVEISFKSKISLCENILSVIHRLHEIEIYHRDIKPDNFMMYGSTVKIGDLGLCVHRNEDLELDKHEFKIGPFGYISPEAVNRALASGRRSVLFNGSCIIDNLSDYFQMGQLFWFIMQGDVPVGQVNSSDFSDTLETGIFNKIIEPLLQFDKSRRPSFDTLSSVFNELSCI